MRSERKPSRARSRTALTVAAGALALAAMGEAFERAAAFGEARVRHAGSGYDLYASGASVAAGWPWSERAGFPAVAARCFGSRVAGLPVLVRPVGGAGDTIDDEARELRRMILFRDRRRPGAALLYPRYPHPRPGAGERVTRLLWRLENGPFRRSLLFEDLVLRTLGALNLGRPTDSASEAVWLERMVSDARAAGLEPVLSTLAVNLRLEPPLYGVSPADAALAAAAALRGSGRWRETLAAYEALDASTPALLRTKAFERARALEALGRAAEAKALYWEAYDPDGLFRRRNDAVRAAAARLGVPLVDAAELFSEGDGLFVDGAHLSLEGQVRLGRAFAEALSARIKEPLARRLPRPSELLRGSTLPLDQPAARACAYAQLAALMLDGGFRWHPAPTNRLAAAESLLAEGTRLNPGSGWLWIGLGSAQAARRRPALLAGFPASERLFVGGLNTPCSLLCERVDAEEAAREFPEADETVKRALRAIAAGSAPACLAP